MMLVEEVLLCSYLVARIQSFVLILFRIVKQV